MATESFERLVSRRQYSELEKRANEYIESGDWKKFLANINCTRSKGKARDALVSLLKMESVGGTDADIFREFSKLEGETLTQIRANATERAMEILEEQIENKHTYFLDTETMTMTPYVVLVKDVIEARKRELEQLEQNPSRIDMVGTYYGFSILMIDGTKPRERDTNRYGYRYWYRSTWLDDNITESAADAVKQLTGEIANEVDMDKTYKILGSSRIFKDRCTKTTADILANAVRLSMYKAPGNRGRAARDLGKTEDSRALPFLHHRLGIEENRRVRRYIVESLGKVGHESSIGVLKEKAKLSGRRFVTNEAEAATEAIGKIYSPQCRETLIELMRDGGNMVKAASIKALSHQKEPRLVDLISPYLVHKSRPVVRASVIALMELGRRGRAAIKKNAPTVIKRIGSDRPSKVAFIKMMSIPEIGKMRSVHEFFAKRIKKYESEIQYWQRRTESRYGYSYSYYWQRREKKARQGLTDFLKLANEYLQPPLYDELVKSVRSITRSQQEPTSPIKSLGRMILDKKPQERKKERSGDRRRLIQTFLDSYR